MIIFKYFNYFQIFRIILIILSMLDSFFKYIQLNIINIFKYIILLNYFECLKYFGMDQIYIWFFIYQNFESVWISYQFRLKFNIYFWIRFIYFGFGFMELDM